MRQKRLIITSIISITLIAVLMMGTTYSIFRTSDIDEEANIYKTGNIDVTYTVSSESITVLNTPVKLEHSIIVKPYRITITNNGNVPYMFNTILEDTTAGEHIDYQYIMTQIGKLEIKSLSNCPNNILKSDTVVPANSSVDIDVRVWISDTTPNKEIGKSFYAKIAIDGQAIPNLSEEIDNKNLQANQPLSNVNVGSYVKYIGNNGCSDNSCRGENANYISAIDMGYCNSDTKKYTQNGWRVGQKKNNSVYLISGGAPECFSTKIEGKTITSSDMDKHLSDLNNATLKYCNPLYAYNNACDNSTTWNMTYSDLQDITKSDLTAPECLYDNNGIQNPNCGYENSLIDNGGDYWLATKSSDKEFYYWSADEAHRSLNITSPTASMGIRPVLRLSPSIIVTGGAGTADDPYTIQTLNTIRDNSKNEHNGTIYGGIWDKKEKTIQMNNQEAYLDCGLANYDFKDQVSFVFRFKMDETITDDEYFLMGNWEDGGMGFSLLNKKLIFSLDTNDPDLLHSYKSYVTNYTLEKDTWYTVVGTYDGTNSSVYINGQKIEWDSAGIAPKWSRNTNDITGSIIPSKVNIAINTNLEYGKYNSNQKHALATYSDVLIFKRALSVEEISTNYMGTIDSVAKEELILQYRF